MTDNFRDHEDRNRFELDVGGTIAFVTYRKSADAITLVHTEVPPELGGQGIGSKLGHATLDAVRSQGRKLHVECDFIRNFMTKYPEYNDLLAQTEQKQTDAATYKAGCFCGAVELRGDRQAGIRGVLSLPRLPGLVGSTDQCLQPVEVGQRTDHQGRSRYRNLSQD